MAESPVVIMAGATAMILKGRGSLQDIDQQSLMRSTVKQQWSIKRVRDIVPTVRAALAAASAGVPGPVFIEYPIEVLWPGEMMASMVGVGDDKKDKDKKKEAAAASSGSWRQQLMAKAQEWYLKRHFENVFANAFDVQPPAAAAFSLFALASASNATPSSSQLQQCAEALLRARRPLVLLGSQATVRT